ncbi:MAG: hypothetical protein QOC57_847 [Ilumatobacteraceae bacterium]
MSAGGATSAAGTAAPSAAIDAAIPPGVGPATELPQPVEQAGLRAGSVDDNSNFADFLTYLARIHDLGIETRDFDPAGRVVVTVVGTSGLPVAGALVSVVAAGSEVASLRTTADGTARFLPALYGAGAIPEFTFTTGDVSVNAAPGSSVTLQPASVGGRSGPVALDVLFLLDATG